MKTTSKQFEQFKEAFIKYQNMFGLQGYRVVFWHVDIPDNDCYADINIDEFGKIATVRYAKSYPPHGDIEFRSPEETAKHEAIHLLINRLKWLGSSRYIETCDLQEEDEKLVRVLEKVIA